MCGTPRRALLPALVCIATTLRAGGAISGFVAAPCKFTVPAAPRVDCGWLTVPEDRLRGSSRRQIRLHIAIYRSPNPKHQPDSIVWLVGGPGGRGNAFASMLYARVVAPYHSNRDFIVMDVRGTGYSEPALDCPDPSGPAVQWVPACRERLARVAELSSYNSAAVAADLADLRRALGLREWNLLGESYGTRLALTALRDRPEGIRAVVLDSVVPPETDEYADGPGKFENAVNALLAGCTADPACGKAFPDLRRALTQAATRLDRSPRRLTGVWHGTPYEFRLDGAQLFEALRMALYESDMIPNLPKAIYHAADGGGDAIWTEAIARHAIFIAKHAVDVGAQLSFHCSEEVPFADLARLASEDRKRAWMRHAGSGAAIAEACRIWSVRASDRRETLPVVSDVPVLLLAGEYDPVTPPSYARSAASHLRNSYLFEFRGLGHQLTANTVSNCPQAVALEFLADPKRRPAAPCLAEWKPRWIVD